MLLPLVSCAVLASVALYANADFYQFYATNLRGSLFSGFLTLTGFLFAVKTFLVINMKKELYDTPTYQERYAAHLETNKNIKIYGPLRNLSRWLLGAVVASLVTAVSQLSIGLIPHWTAAVFCMAAALSTVGLLGFILYTLRNNLASWFDVIEKDAAKKRTAGKT